MHRNRFVAAGLPWAAAVVLVFLMGLAVPREARATTVLNLSEYSSDETPADCLSGLLTFTVTGDSLVLSVTNDTTSPNDYYINQIYFNIGADLSKMTLTSAPSNWSLDYDEDGNKAGGFGYFDVELSTNKKAAQVAPGKTLSFTFTFKGLSSSLTDTLFTTEWSTSGHPSALGVAKFVRGPGDDSAFGSAYFVATPPDPTPTGGTVPEPVSLSVLGLAAGLGAVASRLRRSR